MFRKSIEGSFMSVLAKINLINIGIVRPINGYKMRIHVFNNYVYYGENKEW